MEWVETTGRTVDEALERALDELGVDAEEAEWEVLAEPKVGLFGRLKSEARVRTRVRPTAPRSKDQPQRGRNRRDRGPGRKSDRGGTTNGGKAAKAAQSSGTAKKSESTGDDQGSDEETVDAQLSETDTPDRGGKSRNRRRRKPTSRPYEGETMADEEVALEEQGEVAKQFVTELLGRAGASVDVAVRVDDEEEIAFLAVSGDDLGHFIGPRGNTLQAIQELTRAAVQRQSGARNGRIVLDIADYRKKRQAALSRFSTDVAQQVLESESPRSLEPMNPADRKIVHDTIAGIDGVESYSEGEEARRHVVIRPSDD